MARTQTAFSFKPSQRDCDEVSEEAVMFCSMVLGFFVGALAFKVVRHALFFHGGGCHARRFGPYGVAFYGRGYGSGCGPGFGGPGFGPGAGSGCGPGRGWAGYGGPGAYDGWDPRGDVGVRGVSRGKATGITLDEVTRSLELHERQRAEADPVLNRVKEWLGSRGPRIEAVLSVLAAERFDVEALLPIVAELPPTERRELLEGLEHLHTILISEQREVLRKALGLSPSTQS